MVDLEIEITQLIFDEWNIAHIARHNVTREEVLEVTQGDYLVREADKGRLALLEPTRSMRILFVVIDPEPERGVYYLVTAYTASRRFRSLYDQEKGGEAA